MPRTDAATIGGEPVGRNQDANLKFITIAVADGDALQRDTFTDSE